MLWALGAILLAGLALYELKSVLTPIFFAFLIAYFLDPLVDRFEKRGVPRAVGIVLLLTLLLAALTLVVLLVVPGVVHEVAAFARELPARIERLRVAAEPVLAQYGVPVPHSLAELRELLEPEGRERAGASAQELASHATPVLKTIGGWIWGGTASLISVVGTLFIVPVFAFYLLHDFDPMTKGIRELVPARVRPFVVDVAREVDQVLGQFVRGQLLVMAILAVLYSIAYSLCGVRLAIPIGIVAGLVSFIPYVGGATALSLALLMCALSPQGWGQVAGVVVAYGIIQVLEGFVITPRIVGDKVGLPAIWVLVALMIGGELFGFLGVLLALPAAAVAKIFVVRAVAYYKKTPLYTEGPEHAPAGALAGILTEEGLPDDEGLVSLKLDALELAATAPASERVPESAGEDAEPEAAADLEQAIASALASIPPPPGDGAGDTLDTDNSDLGEPDTDEPEEPK